MLLPRRKMALLVTIVLIILLACTFTSTSAPLANIPGAPQTNAAQTWSYMQTIAYLSATPTFTAVPATNTPIPTDTPRSTYTPTQTYTPIPMITMRPTNTPIPPTLTFTPTVIPTATRIFRSGGGGSSGGGNSGGGSGGGGSGGGTTDTCYSAKLVRDVTIPNGQMLSPGTAFTKIWRVQNTGTCSWDSATYMTLADTSLWAGASLPVGKTVKPGSSADFSVLLTLPNTAAPTEYIANFELQVERKVSIGPEDKSFFKVKVVASNNSGTVYDYINPNNICNAVWRNQANKQLGCPGKIGTEIGFVTSLPRKSNINYPPIMEDDQVYPSILWTHPAMREGGEINGVFPAILVQPGTRLRARVGCLAGYNKCQAGVALYYQLLGGDPNPLFFPYHPEVYDGALNTIFDESISSGAVDFTNKYVSFAVSVVAINNTEKNAIGWVQLEAYR